MAGYPYDCPDQSHDNLELLKASLHLKEVLYFKLSPLRLHGPFRLGNFSAWWFTDQWPQRLGSRRMRWRGMLHGDSLLEGLPKRKFLGEIFFAYVRAQTLSSYKITIYLPTGCFYPCIGPTCSYTPLWSVRDGLPQILSSTTCPSCSLLLSVVNWDEGGHSVIRTAMEGQAWGWWLGPRVASYTFPDTGLNEAEHELGRSEGFMLTVPPEAAWCALLCCSSSFTVIFTRTPWYTLGFSGERQPSQWSSVRFGCQAGVWGSSL